MSENTFIIIIFAVQIVPFLFMQSSVIFPLFYLPPVSFFKEYINHQNQAVLEIHEHFLKQTYRNRATILSPNGKLDLIIPVIKGASSLGHTKFKDVKISYEYNWQRLHWKSFESCYRSSAYFEYYEAEFEKFFTNKYEYLIEFNLDLFNWILQKLKKPIEIQFTESFTSYSTEEFDKRLCFNPKKGINLEYKPYYQVFDDREGFQPNLSIVDLLFNQGPQSLHYI